MNFTGSFLISQYVLIILEHNLQTDSPVTHIYAGSIFPKTTKSEIVLH